MIRLFATIRKESKYRDQQPVDDSGRPIPFEVVLDIEADPFYALRGGPGGAYALFDVDLYAHSRGRYVKLPLHSVEHFPSGGFWPASTDGSADEMRFEIQVEERRDQQ